MRKKHGGKNESKKSSNYNQLRVTRFLKKLNKVLEDNDPLIDFISKIVLTIITISIAINANNIAKKQAKLEEINIIPNISIEETPTEYNTNFIKVYNHGGPVYNLESTSFSILNIISLTNDEFIKIPVKLYHKTETGNQTGLLLEYKEYVHSDEEELENYINQRFIEENLKYKISASTITYIKISYADKLNNMTTKYFTDNTLIPIQTAENVEKIYATTEPINLIQSDFEEIYQYCITKLKDTF